jgi:hypothetical protein
MQMATHSLPRRLRYLEPVIDQLATISPDELNEDNQFAFTLVRDALQQRVANLSPSKAEKTLEVDAYALNAWLARPSQEQSPAHFIAGSLLGILSFDGIAELLGNEPEPELPPLKFKVTMNAPEGFEMTEDYGWIILKARKLVVTINPFADRPFGFMEPGPPVLLAALGLVDSRVSFGDVWGKKRLSVINNTKGFLKDVGYELVVPGGWVQIGAQSTEDFDEAILEASFHTLRVVPVELSTA